ncbi:RNA polymerase sigma factor [Variovorax boronicumulans]
MDMNLGYGLESPSGDEATNEPLGGPPDEPQRFIELQGFLVAHYARLLQRLVRHLSCPEMARECLHDAWLRLHEMDVRSPVQNPEAYVYRVACNAAMDRMRVNRSWQYTGDADVALEQLVDHAPGPELIAETRSELQAVDRAIGRMPRRHWAVLRALRIDEMTRSEVAARYDLSLRGVDTVLRQALDHCAGQLRDGPDRNFSR